MYDCSCHSSDETMRNTLFFNNGGATHFPNTYNTCTSSTN
ncbi:hypothetical protein BMB171_C1388 [Bacillus thuringiensis BMB171]|nr:hypothetical protein BMB171_C1388 [Bacillus thuringiensis BMB171]